MGNNLNNKMPSKIGEYKVTKTLGSGITSKVKLGQDS